MDKHIGVCTFCGQIQHIECDEGIVPSEELLNKMAVLQCKCPEARNQTELWDLINETKQQLGKFFKNENPDCLIEEEVLENLRSLTENFIIYLVDGTVSSVSVDIDGIGKVTLSRKNNLLRVKKQTTAEIIRGK